VINEAAWPKLGEKLMAAFDSNDPIPPDRSNALVPVNRLNEHPRHSFDQHAAVFIPGSLLEVFLREIRLHEEEEARNETWPVRSESDWTGASSIDRPPLTDEDIRLHAWLHERLAILHYERHGLWPRLRRFLFGNRLARWLGFQA
jgi:hypothetical protein